MTNESNVLANGLLAPALLKNAEGHIKKAQIDLGRGAQSQVEENLNRASSEILSALVNEVSPNLSQQDNEEWVSLKAKVFRLGSADPDSPNYVNYEDWKRCNDLGRKADGING